jgi:hypothetical protein
MVKHVAIAAPVKGRFPEANAREINAEGRIKTLAVGAAMEIQAS